MKPLLFSVLPVAAALLWACHEQTAPVSDADDVGDSLEITGEDRADQFQPECQPCFVDQSCRFTSLCMDSKTTVQCATVDRRNVPGPGGAICCEGRLCENGDTAQCPEGERCFERFEGEPENRTFNEARCLPPPDAATDADDEGWTEPESYQTACR
jgi:hypothetical protein